MAERSNLDAMVNKTKSIADIISKACTVYLEKYPEPVKTLFFREHSNQSHAKELKILADNFLELIRNVSENEIIKFLARVYYILDHVSEDSLKKEICGSPNIDEYTIVIISKIIDESPQQIVTSIALENSGIGGKSIRGYLRYAALVISEKETMSP